MRSLLYLGVVVPVIFWVSTIVAGFIDGGYDHLTMTVSALGALGAPAQMFMSAASILCAVLSIAFMIGLFQALRLLDVSVVPILTIPAFTIMMAWAAVFPSGNPLHASLGFIFLLLYAGMLLCFFLWMGKRKMRFLRWMSLLSFVVMSLIFLRFIPGIQNKYPGLIQRFAHAGWSLWFVSLGLGLIKLTSLKTVVSRS